MNIGIIGSGNVGGTLGGRWARGGHNVVFASRNPASEEMKALVAQSGPSSRAATASETAAASDVLLLASPWRATQSMLAAAGDLNGKILIDATNPILPDFSGLELGTSNSGGEAVAQWAPGAKVVKAFNSIGYNIMADPLLQGAPAVLLYCGDDAEAKATVHALAAELGFDPVDLGSLQQARLLEPMAMLWIRLAFTKPHGREFGFRLVTRS